MTMTPKTDSVAVAPTSVQHIVYPPASASVAPPPASGAGHPDDLAVDRFAAALKAKLAEARAKGRGGWNDNEPSMQQRLSDMLRDHVAKGDPRDVGNFAMFLHQRGEAILPPASGEAGVEDVHPTRADILDWLDVAHQDELRKGNEWSYYEKAAALIRRLAAVAPAGMALPNVAALIEAHAAMLPSNPYCYFELAYTRQTDWMAWLCSKSYESDPDRKVLACGQGLTPDEACARALAKLATTPPATAGEE